MSRIVLTDPELEALRKAWGRGAEALGEAAIPDDRWAAVEIALDLPRPAGRGRVEIELDARAGDDLRDGFARGIGECGDEPAIADALAGVAQILDVPAPGAFAP